MHQRVNERPSDKDRKPREKHTFHVIRNTECEAQRLN